MKLEQVATASTAELIAFYNKNCECFGKKQVKNAPPLNCVSAR